LTYNESGRPLSSLSWLKAHHDAKLPEREKYAKKIIKNGSQRIVDLGCGPGFWFDLLNKIASPNCEFMGFDSDLKLIQFAESKTKNWSRLTKFFNFDITEKIEDLPDSDVYLLFNIFPYLHSPKKVLNVLKEKLRPNGLIFVRQYDGSAIRVGPMEQPQRFKFDVSLYNAIGKSKELYHYDLDRIYQIIEASEFKNKNIDFELFQRKCPFPKEFIQYFKNTIEWQLNYLSEDAAVELEHWHKKYILETNMNSSYFFEVDLTATLS